MCRSKACGGRRCKGRTAEERRAYQRTWLAEKRARLRAERSNVIEFAPLTLPQLAQRSAARCAAARTSSSELFANIDHNNAEQMWLQHEAVVRDAGTALDAELDARITERSTSIRAEMEEVAARLDSLNALAMRRVTSLREGAQKESDSRRFRLTAQQSHFLEDLLYRVPEEHVADAKRLIELRRQHATVERDTLVEMLSEHRDMGGATPKYARGSDRKGKETADAACKLLPTAWVQAADEHGRVLWIGSGRTERAHYNSANYHDYTRKTWDSDRDDLLINMPDAISPYLNWGDDTDELRVESRETIAARGLDPDTELARLRALVDEYNESTTDYNKRNRRRFRPPLRLVPTKDKSGLAIQMQKREQGSELFAEITGSVDLPSTMLHELGHRMETHNAEIAELCATFRDRRAGDEELSRIYDKKKGKPEEVGYKDGFGTHYIGKVYHGSVHTEVLSMGLEALFYGGTDSLRGSERTKADPEHRALILGMLATAGTVSDKEYLKLRNDNTGRNLDRDRAQWQRDVAASEGNR